MSATKISGNRQKFIKNEELLVQAAGKVLPAVDDQLLAEADALCARAPVDNDPDVTHRLKWGSDGSYCIPEKLALAYLTTKDERYVTAAARWFAHWLAKEDFTEAGCAKLDSLEISHRIGDTEVPGWLGCLPCLLTSEAFPEELFEQVIAAARNQLNSMSRHKNTSHPSPNIRMTQCDCLLISSLRLSFLEDAKRWQQFGLLGLNDAFFRQFHQDGSSIEATGWYHYIVANMAWRNWRLKKAMPKLGLQVSPGLVARAFDYTVACIEPGGRFNSVGDCTDRAYPFETLAEILAHRRSVLKKLGLPPKDPPTRQIFGDAGQAILRSDWGAKATSVVFDASTWHPHHWHPGCNSIVLSVHGVRMLVDVGRMHYDPTPHRIYALSTRGHNTVTINGWNQSRTEATPLRHRAAPGYDVVDSLYTGGYWTDERYGIPEGIFAEHHRTLLWVHGRCLVVIDHLANTNLEAKDKPPLSARWKIASNWQCSPGKVVLGKNEALIQRSEASLRMLFAMQVEGSALSVHSGEENPAKGWMANENDEPVPAPQICVQAEPQGPFACHMATVLIPGGKVAPAVECIEAVNPNKKGYGKLALRWEDGSVDTIYWRRRLATALEQVENISTDAALVHITQSKAGALKQALVYDGTYLTPWQKGIRPSRGTYRITPGKK